MASNWELVLRVAGPYLRREYGTAGESLGSLLSPFSFKDYLRGLQEYGSWGDQAVLWAISVMFDVRVTVLTVNMKEMRYRHNDPIECADIAVLLARNHFSPIRK